MVPSKQDKVITTTQLGEHKTVHDLWIAVHGYADHPGGIEILVECAGTDGSEPYDYAGHGEDATATMERFKVGKLAGYQSLSKPKSGGSVASSIYGRGVARFDIWMRGFWLCLPPI
ncbi:hypothetical protein VTI28DRAFT_474 [Corynascus sepedonium]